VALGQIRRALHNGIVNNVEQQLFFETYAQNQLFTTEDFLEGAKSFLEKRKPIFKGK
jgi:2-(1,2-epoxy-1,2-dihydrophenyl)acetyl-CoA isomerase